MRAEATGPRIAVAIPWKKRMGMSQSGSATVRYKSGAVRNTSAAITSKRFFPQRSASMPTGKLHRIPATGDTAEMRPITVSLPDSDLTKRGSTGFFDMVVENIPRNPMREMAEIPAGSTGDRPRSAAATPYSLGKTTVNVEPASGFVWTRTFPLYSPRTRFTVASPRPVPAIPEVL
jgi:hypothetical protein